MLLALTGGQKLGIVLVAAAFIAFAIVSSALLPRRDANYPGRRLPLFVFVAVLFFAGMMTAMITLAKEEEGEAHGVPGTHTTGASGTAGGPTGETETTGTTEGAAAQGDPQAGRAIFDAQGCGGCHTLQEANAGGTVGPNLDDLKPGYEPTVEQVTNGGGGMPAFKGRLSEKEIEDVAAFVAQATGS